MIKKQPNAVESMDRGAVEESSCGSRQVSRTRGGKRPVVVGIDVGSAAPGVPGKPAVARCCQPARLPIGD
jgi:hypothetical protein